MSARPCESWAVGKRWWRRLAQRVLLGHARHTCALNRPGFLQNHSGDHVCRCGVSWPLDESDRISRVAPGGDEQP